MALNASIELKRSEEYQCMLLSAPVKLTENGLPTILSTSGGRVVPFGSHGVS